MRDARFRATTCATLVAYAEMLAQRVTGAKLDAAVRVRPTELVRALSGVPAHKQSCAALPIQALQYAIAEAVRHRHERRLA